MADNRPRARQKNVTSGGSGVHRRESVGTGRVGGGSSGGPGGSGGPSRAAIGGGGSLLVVAVVLLMKIFGGGGSGGTGLTGSSGGSSASYPSGFSQSVGSGYVASAGGKVNTDVAAGSRAKYTSIKGGGKDTVTLMVYMCGTDLESKYGMASNDLNEMAAAKYGSNVNIIVYTGGCKEWKTSGISNKVNQIYQVKDGGLKSLVKDDGSKAMTDPDTLSSFIKYCNKNFPADRSDLILWDHGGGSVSGYGYDEKNKNGGSMNLAGISKALKAGGVKFDFVGFDACLMATAETALMLNDYADYMIASEETEPGIGWYYTNWLTQLGSNTSMSTLDIGKVIIDDFVAECGRKCPSSATTLSIIDLAEFANTVPEDLAGFAKSVSGKINDKDYKSISDARNNTREFAKSSKIDQVDLVNLADNVGTPEAKELAASLKNAVKYNRTSSNISDAYGVSIYFPYKRTSYVDTACVTYSQIGMDDEYSKCIRQFAKLETSGQIAAGGTASPVESLFGGLTGGSSGSADIISGLLGSFLGGSGRSIAGLDSGNTDFMRSADISDDTAADYIALNSFDPSKLTWTEKDGKYTLSLTEEQWSMVHLLDLNMFYDDGAGYVDMGLDNVFSFEDGKLVADTEKNWLSINGQPVAYYHTDTTELGGDKYVISGYVPVLLNGERASLIIKFDNDRPGGYVAGASSDYVNGETETIAKSVESLSEGDKIDFLCDFYSYDGVYQESYKLGSQMTVGKQLTVSNTDVGDGEVRLMYKFTDIYNQDYWTEAIKIK